MEGLNDMQIFPLKEFKSRDSIELFLMLRFEGIIGFRQFPSHISTDTAGQKASIMLKNYGWNA